MTTPLSLDEAERLLEQLAGLGAPGLLSHSPLLSDTGRAADDRFRALVEQIPAVVFMADLEQFAGQAYVSPQIEETLGFTQAEWLEDPVRWYQQVHPADKDRWSMEAAEIFLTGKPLNSAYRVHSRDGRVVWFQCRARMVRRPDGSPWLIHGIGVDITDLKQTEAALQEERNFAAGMLDAAGSMLIVLDDGMKIVRFNRVSEQITGKSSAEMAGRYVWELISDLQQAERFRNALEQVRSGQEAPGFETDLDSSTADRRVISWALTDLRDRGIQYVIATGADITARKRLESAVLEISEREQRRIGQDMHDGLGQLLTGIGFIAKAHEDRLLEQSRPEAAIAAKIGGLVREAIRKSRELARGLMPIPAGPSGLMSGLEQLTRDVQDVFGVECRFDSSAIVLIADASTSGHLYRIAQEAINNAIKHGKARSVNVFLSEENGNGSLVIQDSGTGIQRAPGKQSGLGLDIMAHRAKMIGGSLNIVSSERGTTVTCRFPAN